MPHFQQSLLWSRASGRATDAWDALQTSAYLDPQYAPARYNLAAAAMQSGQAAVALPHAEAAVAATPRWAEANLVLANACYETGDKERALIHYRKAAELNPRLPTAAKNAEAVEVELGSDG